MIHLNSPVRGYMFRNKKFQDILKDKSRFFTMGSEKYITYFEEIDKKFKKHGEFSHELFAYLKNSERLSSNQFKIYRDNFFLRTSNTIPSIAKVIIAAVKNLDHETLSTMGKNLYEETGESNHEKSHILLLEKSHNRHGEKIFGLEYLKLNESINSEFIIPETRNFIEKQNQLYESDIYHTVLGVAYAHEMAAEPMLDKIQKYIFEIYRGYYSETEYEEINSYFDVHLGGVELEHGNNAKKAALRICRNKEDVDLIFGGAVEFLDAQANMWNGILREIKKLNHEPRMPIRNDFQLSLDFNLRNLH